MATTSVYGWPVPDPGSGVDVSGDMQALANAVEDTVKGLLTDTGDRSDLAFTPASGWTVDSIVYRIILGKLMTLNIRAHRTGNQIVSQGSGGANPGNLSPDVDVLTIDDTAKRPTSDAESIVHSETTSGAARLKIGGVLTIYDLHAGADIDTDNSVTFTFIYFTP